MVLRSDKNKLTFIVNTISSVGFEKKGGSIVIHKLAYELAKRENFVYVLNEPFYPHKNIGIIKSQKIEKDGGWWSEFTWENFRFDLGRTISIYPQITWGNPFNTINNTRWILHHYSEEQWKTFDKDDYICNFGTFDVPEGTNQTKLTVIDYGLDKYKNLNNPNRKGFAHILHKNTPDWGYEFFKNFGSTEIPHFNGKKDLDYLIEEFNKYEYLLTFDDKTYYTVLAALCGTKSIILNDNNNLTPTEYRLKNPTQMCGVAYGINDIKWANDTINLVRDNLINLEKEDNKTVDNFVDFWKNKLK